MYRVVAGLAPVLMDAVVSTTGRDKLPGGISWVWPDLAAPPGDVSAEDNKGELANNCAVDDGGVTTSLP